MKLLIFNCWILRVADSVYGMSFPDSSPMRKGAFLSPIFLLSFDIRIFFMKTYILISNLSTRVFKIVYSIDLIVSRVLFLSFSE